MLVNPVVSIGASSSCTDRIPIHTLRMDLIGTPGTHPRHHRLYDSMVFIDHTQPAFNMGLLMNIPRVGVFQQDKEGLEKY